MSARTASDLWRPSSDCGPSCQPPDPPEVGLLRRVLRTVTAGSVLVVAVLLPSQAARLSRALLRAMGVRMRVNGPAIQSGALLVGNHISWLDIVVMSALGHDVGGAGVRLVAKQEVAGWPVFGRVGRLRGTIFVDRARPRALPSTVAEVARALRAGQTVQVFPEGTTTCGPHPVRWRPAFLQAAIDAGAPVQPFTLRYHHSAAAFVGEQTLIASLRQVLSARGLSVSVLMGEARPAGSDRRALASRLSHQLIRVSEGTSGSQEAFSESTAQVEPLGVR